MQYDNKKILDLFIRAALKAGEFVKDFRKKHDLEVEIKSDASPVTFADLEAHNIITHILNENLSDIPIISEESIPETADNMDYFILLDPIDGTKSYINGRDDYSINLALIVNQRPVIGMIYLPEEREVFYAIKGEGSYLYWPDKDKLSKRLHVHQPHMEKMTVTLSPFSKDKVERYNSFLNYPITDINYAGSAKKFTLIAKGGVDLYPRFGQTGEWDTAAGDILVHEAGGFVHHIGSDRKHIIYGKKTFMNKGFLAYSCHSILDYEKIDLILTT